MDSLKSDAIPEPDTDDADVQIMPLDQHGAAGEWVGRWQVTTRRRAFILRVALALAAVLLVVIMLTSNTLSIGAFTHNALSRLFPAATPTLPPLPETNLFYLDTNVPNEQITLDGHLLRHVPLLDVDPPLKLAPGRHVFTWSAYPFRAQSCTISAPYVSGDTCNFTPYYLTVPGSTLSAQVLLLNESPATLPGNLQQSLAVAMQTTIDGIHDNIRVQPGELYFAAPQGDTTAHQPLIATLRFNFTMQPHLVSPLTIDGVTCQQLCIAPWRFPATAPVPLPRTPGTWLSIVLANMSWDYTTPGGQPIALSQPLDFGAAGAGAHPMLVRTTWTGSAWQVTPLIGARQVPPLLIYSGISDSRQSPRAVAPVGVTTLDDDPSCVAAEDIFLNDPSNSDSASIRFISGPNIADGCLVATPIVTHAPIAYYLEHFGVLLAVNTAARIAYSGLPLADANERALARQLLSPSGQSSQYAP
ncbi:MAG TPA: hypothetical protein VNE61_12165 [Ktedonobacteraceae bacterium]|nr:hypothetical protein [Ktedonobacteraceae bacterium]